MYINNHQVLLSPFTVTVTVTGKTITNVKDMLTCSLCRRFTTKLFGKPDGV